MNVFLYLALEMLSNSVVRPWMAKLRCVWDLTWETGLTPFLQSLGI